MENLGHVVQIHFYIPFAVNVILALLKSAMLVLRSVLAILQF